MKLPQRSLSRRARRAARGFSLLEIVIVLGIIALLVGGAIGLTGKITNGARIQAANNDINTFTSTLKMYKINANTYPSSQQGLKALVDKPTGNPVPARWTRLMDRTKPDPWGNEYIYKYPGSVDPTEFEIISMGPDGKAGTEDDISNQK